MHWAQDAAEANAIVTRLVRAAGADRVVKVKSMVTQEIGLNEALAAEGIAALETDLAELIVQLGHDRPSHILVPAIHRNRAEIREIFRREMPDAPAVTDDPAALAARRPGAPAAGVPVRAGRHLRRQLRDRRHRLAGRGGVRGQRPDVPDAAADAHLGGGDREDPAVLARPRGVPGPAAPLLDGRADEPVHLDLDRGHARGRAAGLPSRAAGQRPDVRARRPRPAGRRCAASGARPA